MCACKYTSSSGMGGGGGGGGALAVKSPAPSGYAPSVQLALLVFDAYSHCQCFKRNCTPNQKLVCFVHELSQNHQHLFDKMIYAAYRKLSKELKNEIEILVGPAIFKLYTIFALPGSSGWQNLPTRTTQLKTRLDAAVAMRVYSISAGRTLH